MNRTRAVKVLLVGGLAMLLASACKGEVTKKYGCDGTDDKDKPCQMLVVERDKDGKITKERKVNVTKAVFDTCSLGEWYEDDLCKAMSLPHMEEIPAPEVNEPHRRPDRDRQDEQERREVCIEIVSFPKAEIHYDLSIPSYRETKTTTVGNIRRCRTGHVGDIAFAVIEHLTEPSTVMCSIWIYKKGVKHPLDYMITQEFGDCKVRAQIPPL